MNTNMHEPLHSDWRRAPLSRIPKGVPEGGKIGGVVAGISRAYGFDLRTTRFATAVAMIILPVLVLVYIAAWVLLPETPAQAQPIEAIVRDRRRMPLMIVIGLVLVAGSVGSLGSWFLFDGAPWGLMLIALGVLLWVSTSTGRTSSAPPATQAGATQAAATQAPAAMSSNGDPWVTSFPPPTIADGTAGPITDQYAATSFTPSATTRTVPVTTVVTPRRPRRPITSIGVGVAVLWVGLVSALEALGAWDASALWVIVSALGIVLVAMLISIVVNQSWVLPFLFVPLAALFVMLCVAQPRLDGASGQRIVTPNSVGMASTEQHLAAGNLVIDLRDVPMTDDTVQVTAEVGMGRLRVLVPRDADMVIVTDVGAGQAEVNGNEIADGVRQRDTRTVEASDQPASGTFELDLRVGMGQISVEHVASNP